MLRHQWQSSDKETLLPCCHIPASIPLSTQRQLISQQLPTKHPPKRLTEDQTYIEDPDHTHINLIGLNIS